MSLIFLPKEDVSKLKCSQCENYLSVGPITMTDSLLYCGRCKLGLLNATLFETIAKFTVFPCVNDQYGCKDMFRWNTAQIHEESCIFTPIYCPLSPCRSQLSREDFEQHFSKFHQKHILNKPVLTIPKTSLISVNIFEDLGQVFLLMTCFLNDDWVFQTYTINETKGDLFVELIERNNPKPGVNKKFGVKKIQRYKSNTKNSSIPICNRASVNSIFKNNNTVTLIFVITDRPIEGDLGECPLCFENMRPPIHMCSNKHSICSNCFKQVSSCPICKVVIIRKTNKIQQFSTSLTYPCVYKNKGCRFRARLEELRAHENCCGMSQLNPYRRKINKKRDILGIPFTQKLNRMGKQTFETTYNKDDFGIQICFTKTIGLQISMNQLKSSNNSNKYLFAVQLKKDDSEMCMINNFINEKSNNGALTLITLSMVTLQEFVRYDTVKFTLYILLK